MKKKWLLALLLALLFLTSIIGCIRRSGLSKKAEAEPVKLKLVMYGSNGDRKKEFFENEFHDRVMEELNIDLTVEFVSWEAQHGMAARLASGESLACMNILYLNDWIPKGYLAEIEQEQIEEYCPNLLRIREDDSLLSVTYNDKIYGIPIGAKSYAGDTQYILARGDIIRELGYEPEEITTLAKLEEVMAACKEKYPDNTMTSQVDEFLNVALAQEISDRLFLRVSTNNFAVVDELEEGDKVYSYYETEEFKRLCKITSRWADLGYISIEELSNPEQSTTDWGNGNGFLRMGMISAMVSGTSTSGKEEVLLKIGDLPDFKVKDYDYAVSISKADQDKVPYWLQLFDWIYQDQEHYNYCVYGVEGKDWEYNEEGRIERIASGTFFAEWFLSAFEYKQYGESISQEQIDAYESFDDNSRFSKTTGFIFDTSPVASEMSRLNAIYEEKLLPMIFGFLDYEEHYEETLREMKEVGIDAYIAEYQRQYTEWYQQNHAATP